MYALAAELVAAVHLAVVVFMVAGLAAVFIGCARGWSWVRNPWFRLPHLGIAIYLGVNAARGELCFLTHWEYALRERAGLSAEEHSFVGRLVHDLLYLEAAQSSLEALHLAFGVLVVASVVLVRPRLRHPPAPPPDSS